jgi:hypothetical protein
MLRAFLFTKISPTCLRPSFETFFAFAFEDLRIPVVRRQYYFPSVLMIVAGQPVQLGEANAPSRIQRKKLDDNPPLALEA